MGIAYASVNSILMNFSGNVIAKEQNEIFITEIKCFQQDGYDNSLCNTNDIQSSYQTSVHSKISLNNNINSTIIYQITVLNNSDVSYYFDETAYIVGDNTFSNQNITFELKTEDNTSEFLQNTEVPSKTYIKFNLIFKYKDNADILNSDLESLLNFKFTPINYKIIYNSNYPSNSNLIYNLSDCTNIRHSSITYSINNSVISVYGDTNPNENIGYINARVDLEAGKSYIMSYDTLYQSASSVQMWLIYQGITSDSKNYTGTDGKQLEVTNAGSKVIKPQITGTYHIRLDVNASNNDYAVFYNLSVVENTEIVNETTISEHTYNQEKALTKNNFKRNNLIFKEWNTKADGSGESFTDSQIVKNLTTVDADIINLYAQWEEKVTVALDANGGTFNNNSNLYATHLIKGDTFALTEIPTKNNHVFLGWAYNLNDNTITYHNDSNLIINNGIVLYAIWEEYVEVGPITTNFITNNMSAYNNTSIVYDSIYDAAKFTITKSSEDNGVFIKVISDNEASTLLGKTYPYSVIVYNVSHTSNNTINIFPNMDTDSNKTNYGIQYQWRVNGTLSESSNTWETIIFNMYTLENMICEQKDGSTKTHTYKDKYIRGFRFDYFNGLVDENSTFYLKKFYLCKSIECANILSEKYQNVIIK